MLTNIKDNHFKLINKLREKKHRITFKKKYKPMEEALYRFKNCENKKPKSQISSEMTLCKKFWGCYPLHYLRYDLYRKDKILSDAELLNYIPEFFFYELFLPFHNPKQYKILLADKIITEQFFRSLSFPQPQTICKLINSNIYTKRMERITYKIVEQELNNIQCCKIFVKPSFGEGGHGIYIFNRNDAGQYVASNKDRFDEDFLNKIKNIGNFIIESGVDQDPEMARIHPNSTNTFRIYTENINGNIRILRCSILRFGRSGNQVDNADSGGIFIKYDVDTGETGDYAVSMIGECFDKHPDTNVIFKGLKIKRYNEVKEFVIEITKKIPQSTYLSWDIAMTKTGPLVIEAHSGFGLEALNLLFGGIRDILRINSPQYYWRNRGKK